MVLRVLKYHWSILIHRQRTTLFSHGSVWSQPDEAFRFCWHMQARNGAQISAAAIWPDFRDCIMAYGKTYKKSQICRDLLFYSFSIAFLRLFCGCSMSSLDDVHHVRLVMFRISILRTSMVTMKQSEDTGGTWELFIWVWVKTRYPNNWMVNTKL